MTFRPKLAILGCINSPQPSWAIRCMPESGDLLITPTRTNFIHHWRSGPCLTLTSILQEVATQMRRVQRGGLSGLHSVESGDSDMSWNVLIDGPQRSPFEGSVLSFRMDFPDHYPYTPPKIFFNHELFHPNVHGYSSMHELCWHDDDQTGSTYRADVIIAAVINLLMNPNPDSPANSHAAELYKNNMPAYVKRARQVAQAAFF